jgi:chemotaxis protein methyltransferase CheR
MYNTYFTLPLEVINVMNTSKIPLGQDEFVLLKDYIHQECGIVVSEDKAYLIESRLVKLLYEEECTSFKEFYVKAKHDTTGKLKIKIIDAMTTNETLWFRDEKPWELVRDIIIPKFLDDLRNKRKDRIIIWSAGVSTGQEAYSFAMLLDEALKKEPQISPEQFYILATDISVSALFMAISGRYNNIVMSRGMLPGYKEKYFVSDNGVWEINPTIKNMVTFKQFNLQMPFEKIPVCDLIFCRNVSIYFSQNFKTELFKRIYDSLYSDGFFLIGASESLFGYSDDFEQMEFQKTLYYKPRK